MAPIATSKEPAVSPGPNNAGFKAAVAVSPNFFHCHASSTEAAIAAEREYAAHNYHPIPVVFARALGTSVWDPEGRQYLDFLSAYSAVNQGHCHPELVKALVDQAATLTISSRAFYNDVFPKFAEFVTKFFGFDMVLPMNTGAEAVETSMKIARKWGYKVKGIPPNEAIILTPEDNFHGRTVSEDDVPFLFCAVTDLLHSLQQYRCLRIQSRETITDPIFP
jgi:ornithine--oxo-acid transaminase